MSIDALLVLVLFLGATWFGLLDSILAVTKDNPAEHSLFLAAFVHFTVLLYFLITSFVLYGKTVYSATNRHLPWLQNSEIFLAVTWPAAIIGAATGFAVTKLTGMMNPIIPIGVFVLSVWWFTRQVKRRQLLQNLMWASLTIAAFMPYLLVMSWVWADVSIQTDHDSYRRGETAIITVRSKGYLFNPYIKEIEIWGKDYGDYKVPEHVATSYFRVAHVIKADVEVGKVTTWLDTTLIHVVYSPQSYWSTRDQYRDLDILP